MFGVRALKPEEHPPAPAGASAAQCPAAASDAHDELALIAAAPLPVGAGDRLAGMLARCVQTRTAIVSRASGPLLQRAIAVGAKTYSVEELAAALKADEDVVWHEEYLPELHALHARDETFADHGRLMMWLAGAVMAAKRPASALPDEAAAVSPGKSEAKPGPTGKAAAATLPATHVRQSELDKAAPVGGTAGQRYDKQAATHTSVTFKSVSLGVFRIVGFHRTLASGEHYYWAKHAGDGKFKLSSGSGTEIESVRRSKVLEAAWKAVDRVARKLRCEALEPTWQ